MNYFFGLKNKDLKSKITIPRFQNRGEINKEYKLYSAEAVDDRWKVLNSNCDSDGNFYYIEDDLLNNKKIFFLAKSNEIKKLEEINYKYLIDLNTFTNTWPDFRSNLRIYNEQGGFSSYQSEYPHSMIKKKGSVLSPISSLANRDAEQNKVFFINIYEKPIEEEFDVFFVDYFLKKIVFKKKIKTNFMNEIDIEKSFINPNIFLFTKPYIAIPIFVSIKNGHISFEHTHPPHEYILSKDKHKKASDLKREINEIVS